MNVTLTKLNFTRCDTEQCLYVRRDGTEFVILALYVDNLILTSNSPTLLARVKAELKSSYKMTDLGNLSWCLGNQVARTQESITLD